MENPIWAIVVIGGPILIAAALIYGILVHIYPTRREARKRNQAVMGLSDEPKE